MIRPYLNNKTDANMSISLNSFRDNYVWDTKVNNILECNLEGIMEIFTKYSEADGFVAESAY